MGPGQTVEDITAVGVPVYVAGTVAETVIAVGGELTLAETAHVKGDVYVLGGALAQDPRAEVGGSITIIAPVVLQAIRLGHPGILLGALLLVHLVLVLAAGTIAWYLAATPVATRQTRRLIARPVRGLGLGLLWATLLGTSALVASLTVIGLPVGLLLLAFLGGEGVLGAAMLIGWIREPGRFPPRSRGVLLGVVACLGIIPGVGGMLLFGLSVPGLGATLEAIAENCGTRRALLEMAQ